MLAGYTYNQSLYVGAHTVVYRGLRDATGEAVIIKLVKSEYPTPEEIASLTYEYEIGCRLAQTAIVRPLELVRHQHQVALVLEDIGGDPLSDWIAQQPFDVASFLPIAIALADAVGHLHRQHVIHKDIKPANIILNPATGSVRLIDFGISSLLSKENAAVRNPDRLQGTLAYMAPEQTGRMNRTIDYRTDFYSLGVTFYEMLTGILPFRLSDALELVHAHIAKLPIPAHDVRASIPVGLSAIISKLMAKTAEDRYQSAYGLKADLTTCWEQWQAHGTITPFELGQHDHADVFQIPQKLYGREQEIATLLQAFERVATGGAETLLVAGYSGIGKSSLVAEVHKPIVSRRGYMISGKFDQLHRSIPYSAVIQAFGDLMRQLLTESEAELARWQAQLTAALGVNGQIIVDVIPEVALVLGPQPAVAELPVIEAQNRFNFVFGRFVRVFAQVEHPLVIFLDDVQWADSASLAFIELIGRDVALRYLLLLAYRENEVSATHPLQTTVQTLRTAGHPINQITLPPLSAAQVAALIADAVQSEDAIEPLAQLVWQKTHGNPFFINQFLTTLVEREALHFDSEHGSWRWDIDQIATMDITDNVVTLMTAKIQKLPAATVTALQRAACIGNQFELPMLARVSAMSPLQTANVLWEAVREGLVVPLNDHYKLLSELDSDLAEALTTSLRMSYRFLHDRVQQAAYALVADSEKQALHLQIGRTLYENSAANHDETLFDVVNHLNLGAALITDPAERHAVARLNDAASHRASSANAYALALNYAQTGISLLGDRAWQVDAPLALNLHTAAAEAAYFTTAFALMDRSIRTVLDHAPTTLAKVRVYELQIVAFNTQNKLPEALQTANHALKLLNVELPANPSLLHVGRGLLGTMLALRDKKPADLNRLPPMTDPTTLAAMRILMSTISPAYIAAPNLFPLIAFKMVELSLRYGNSPLSPFGYMVYGVLLSGAVGNFKRAYELGTFAFELGERLHSQEIQAKLYVSLHATIAPWRTHVRETLPAFLAGYQRGLDAGDVLYACHNIMYYCYHLLWVGEPLAQVEREQNQYFAVMNSYQQAFHMAYTAIWRHVVAGLRDGQADLRRIAAPIEALIGELKQTNNLTALFCAHLALAQSYYLFGDSATALQHARQGRKLAQAVLGSITTSELVFYHALALLDQADGARGSTRRLLLRQVAGPLRKLRKWAHHAPMNYAAKYELVRAEHARVLGDGVAALAAYDRAIDSARSHGFVQIEALACELAGRWFAAQAKPRIANHYLGDARYAYEQWGANAKISQLEREFASILALTSNETPQRRPISTSESTHSTLSLNTSNNSGLLDLNSVLKAAQAITGEIVLPTLLTTLMRIMLENAGASRGLLLMPRNGSFVIEAEGAVDQETVAVLQAMPLNSPAAAERLSASIVHYVARTREPLVLNNAQHEGAFTRDVYVQRQHPVAVLCAPLLNRGELTAIIYLENNLAVGAFSAERLELLHILSAEAAISIENANLYTNLENLVEQRTSELRTANITLQTVTNRLQGELALAQKIQRSLLPLDHIAVDGLDVVSYSMPAREVGGDFFTYHQGTDRFIAAVGDVSGKGMPAALIMAVSLASLQAVIGNGASPSALLNHLDQTLMPYTRTTRQNCAVCYVEISADSVRLANAGCIPPLIRHADGRTTWLDIGGVPLGIGLGSRTGYAEETVPLHVGDMIILSSDGAVESMNGNHELFGFERFEATAAAGPGDNARAMLEHLHTAIQHFSDGTEPHDDITLVVVYKHG